MSFLHKRQVIIYQGAFSIRKTFIPFQQGERPSRKNGKARKLASIIKPFSFLLKQAKQWGNGYRNCTALFLRQSLHRHPFPKVFDGVGQDREGVVFDKHDAHGLEELLDEIAGFKVFFCRFHFAVPFRLQPVLRAEKNVCSP